MNAQAVVPRVPRNWLLWLLVTLAGFLVLVVAYSLGDMTSTKEQASIVAGSVDASGQAAKQAPMYSGKAGGRGGGGGGARGGGMGRGGASGGYAPETARAATPGFEAESPTPNIATANLPWPAGPMLIRTADLRVRVDDVAKAHQEVARIAREAHGYIAETTFSSESGPASATVTIRVPSQGLDSAVDRISALGKLLNKQVSAQEVTEEYVDLTSRRRNLEREEQRLLELLKRAGKMRELLDVESTLARVRGQVEQISGRMRYLENRVSLSTVTVNLEGPQPKPNVGGPVWAASDVSREAVRSLIGTGRGLATLAIWIGIYTPIWLPIAIFFIWLVRKTAPRRVETPAETSAADP
jgi:hypothetical protein